MKNKVVVLVIAALCVICTGAVAIQKPNLEIDPEVQEVKSRIAEFGYSFVSRQYEKMWEMLALRHRHEISRNKYATLLKKFLNGTTLLWWDPIGDPTIIKKNTWAIARILLTLEIPKEPLYYECYSIVWLKRNGAWYLWAVYSCIDDDFIKENILKWNTDDNHQK